MAFVCRRRAFRCIFARWLLLAMGSVLNSRSRIPFLHRSRRMPLQSLTRLPEERASVKRRLRPAGNDGASRRIPSPISHIPYPISHLSPSPGRLYILINKVFVYRQQSRSLSSSAVIFGAGGVFPAFLSVRSISVFRRLS